MTKSFFHEKIVLILSLLILNNYLLISLSLPQVLIKVNFLFFLTTIAIFYLINFSENLYFKIFFIVFITLGTPTVDWDPRSIWLFHAKMMFYENSVSYVADNYAAFSNNDYPKIAPAFASSLAVLIGHWNEVFPKLSFLLIFFPPVILMYSFFKSTQYIIFLSIVFFTISKYLFSGWADGIVAVYFGMSAFLMYLLIIEDNNYYKKHFVINLITICFFIILTLVKNEGTILLLILFLTTFIIKLFKKNTSKDIYRLLLLSISFLPIILWKYFCYIKGIGSAFINPDLISNLVLRLYEFENYKLISYFIFLNEKFLLCSIFFLLSFWIKKNVVVFSYISISTMIYIFILFLIYLSTPFDFYWQLDSSAARVVKSLSFLLAFFGLYNLKDYTMK